MIRRHPILLVCLLLGIFTFLSVGSAIRESLTFDEIVHMQEGKNAWLHHTFLIDTNNPPLIRELAVIPLILGADKATHSPYPNIRVLPGRLVIALMGVLLGLGIYLVGTAYFGVDIGFFALFLYVFEPNQLAYSHYITQDLGAVFFFFLAYLSLVRMVRHPKLSNYLIHGILVGLMAASKITTLPFYLLSAVIALPVMLGNTIVPWFRKTKFLSLLAVPVCFLVIWSTYFFKTNVIVAPGDAKGRVSTELEMMAKQQHNYVFLNLLDTLRYQPVPLGDYIAVLKNTMVRSTLPSVYFFMGSFYRSSQWYFLPVNIFFKTPLPLLILFLMGIVMVIRLRKNRELGFVVVVPVISILIVGMFTKMQPLVRYVLPIYPFFILVAAASLAYCRKKYQKILLILFCVWYMYGTIGSYPHFISYTNELAGTGNERVLNFMDSNMDWGQSLISFTLYVQKVEPLNINFSYFGRDDATRYGFLSNTPYGSYKSDEICAFHQLNYPKNTGSSITAISLSNWYYCDYYQMQKFQKGRIVGVVGNAILLF